MYNIQTFYGWQTQYKCVMSTHKIFYEYTQMCPHSTTKYTMNIPQIIYIDHEIHSEHTVRRRGRFIAPVFTKYQFCECLSSFYGCLHICGHDKSTPTAADGLR